MNVPFKKIREVAEVVMGTSPKGHTYNITGEGLPLLNGPTEFGDSHPECSIYTTKSFKECNVGDLIFCVRGSTTGRMNWADKVYSLGRGVCAIRGETELDTKYIQYCLTYKLTSLLQFASGSTFPNLPQDTIKDFEFPFPNNRKEIANTLSTYDDLIENNRRRMALLEDAARQVYHEWFVRLRFPGYEHSRIVDDVQEGWERMPLESALVLQRGFDLPSQSRQEGTVPIYASTGVNGYHNVAKVKAPGIVTGRSGSLGMVHYVHEDFWPLNTSLWVKEFRCVSPLFAFFLLSSLRLDQYNGGVSVPTLDRKVVHKIEVVVPNSKIQGLFGDYILPMFTQIRQLGIYNDKLRTARDLLLPMLMSGEIAV